MLEFLLVKTARPPALRTLINQYLDDANLGVFAGQALTARSWVRNDLAVRKIFNEMIESMMAGHTSFEAVNKAGAELYELQRQSR